jgi:protein involved in polysaccharide export with SLBB domain
MSSVPPRWFNLIVVMILGAFPAFAGTDVAGLPAAEASALPSGLGGLSARGKTGWLQRLTLGPGDAVNFSIYGDPTSTRADVAVEPDGRISYLQVQGLPAAGLTLDELRDSMTVELAKHHRRPRLVVTPAAFRSKRVFVLGKVVNKGACTLDRPMTILEAVAQAGGLETGLFQLNTVELADLPRSFLIRKNQRLSVDFEKLFLRGDLSQNILLEPDDYIYFPSATANEIYVLGSVRSPGAQGLTSEATVLSAITLAGGYTERAYRQRILVVRGGIQQPQTFTVNLADVLAGRGKDFRLEPRDIVYVADRPWSRIEDLGDMAATAFIQTMVTVWTGGNIGPMIRQPILPSLTQ